MGSDDLEIVSCRIPALAPRLASQRIARLAEYPLARASEWSPLPAGPVSISGSGDDSDELVD